MSIFFNLNTKTWVVLHRVNLIMIFVKKIHTKKTRLQIVVLHLVNLIMIKIKRVHTKKMHLQNVVLRRVNVPAIINTRKARFRSVIV